MPGPGKKMLNAAQAKKANMATMKHRTASRPGTAGKRIVKKGHTAAGTATGRSQAVNKEKGAAAFKAKKAGFNASGPSAQKRMGMNKSGKLEGKLLARKQQSVNAGIKKQGKISKTGNFKGAFGGGNMKK